MKKVVIHTLGCKVNQYESDSLANSLEQLGYVVSTNLEKAEYYIINTCAVTNEAEKKSRQMIAKVKRHNPNAKIIVTGCASQKNADQFSKLEGVTYVCGIKNKLAIIDNLDKTGTHVQKLNSEYDENYFPKPSRTRAFVKIQDGCNNFCSYCIIPYLRGRSRSRDIIEILHEVGKLSKDAKEIVITGINITDYKIENEPALSILLSQLENFDCRFRLGSLEQSITDEKFMEQVSKMKNLCPHFHLSLQSGSENVLKRMNRHYTKEEYLRSVEMLRKAKNNPAITTDVIVGFPGETEEEFEETMKFCEQVGFAYMHIFPYSLREGTPASKMKQVSPSDKKRRVDILEKLNVKLQKKYTKSCHKGTHQLLLEEKQGKFYVGHTENYVKCFVKAKNLEENEFYNVKIKRPYEDGAFAKIVK